MGILTGVAMIVIGIWINGNWERITESEKVEILKRSNRFVCFVLFNLLPALPLAFYSAAVAMGIYAGIHNLSSDAPLTFRDGILFVTFSAVYCVGLYAFLPFPFGTADRPRIENRK